MASELLPEERVNSKGSYHQKARTLAGHSKQSLERRG